MAIDYPAARVGVRPIHLRRTRPLLSGDAAGDKAYGWRGWSSECNHAYGYRVHTIASHNPVNADTVSCASSLTNPGWDSLTGVIPYRCGADVAAIEAIVDCEDADIQISTDEGDSAGSSQAGRGVLTETYSLVDTTGAVRLIHLHLRSTDGFTQAYVYRWLIREVILVAGDIP